MQDPNATPQPKAQSFRIWGCPLHGEGINLGVTSTDEDTSTVDQCSRARYIICGLQSVVSFSSSYTVMGEAQVGAGGYYFAQRSQANSPIPVTLQVMMLATELTVCACSL